MLSWFFTEKVSHSFLSFLSSVRHTAFLLRDRKTETLLQSSRKPAVRNFFSVRESAVPTVLSFIPSKEAVSLL